MKSAGMQADVVVTVVEQDKSACLVSTRRWQWRLMFVLLAGICT